MSFVYCKILNFIILQSLYKAKENEIETEHHFKALAEREYGHLKSDIKRLKDEIASLRQKKNIQEVRFEFLEGNTYIAKFYGLSLTCTQSYSSISQE